MKVGDVVRLKSGGPKMTVWSLERPDSVDVVWFDPAGEERHSAFSTAELRKVRWFD